MQLAAALASAGLPSGVPATLATVDRTGRVDTAVAGAWPDGRPVTPDDQFYAASLAKQVTGAALALLVQDGRIDPDLPIAIYLDGHLPGWSQTVTARQLAQHTAGLPAAGVLEASIPGHWTTLSVLAALRELPMVTSGAHLYSNVGYVLLAELIAAVSGQTFAAFVESRLGLHFPTDISAFPQTAMLGRTLPLSHGDGGLWTTAADYARWLHRQNRDEFGIEAMVTEPGPGDYGWGLGLRRFRGELLLIHGGTWQGASAKAVRSPALGVGAVALVAGDEIDRVVRLVDAVLDSMAARSELG